MSDMNKRDELAEEHMQIKAERMADTGEDVELDELTEAFKAGWDACLAEKTKDREEAWQRVMADLEYKVTEKLNE